MPALTIFGNPPRGKRGGPRSVWVPRVGDRVRVLSYSQEWTIKRFFQGTQDFREQAELEHVGQGGRVFSVREAVHNLRQAGTGLEPADEDYLAASEHSSKPKAPASSILSRRAIALSYKHAEVGGAAYQHEFASGVTVELLSDGSVRLFRPDGLPLFKFFKRK